MRAQLGVLLAAISGGAVVAQQPLTGGLALQSASSSLTLGGSLAGFPVSQQANGSLTTSYSGTTGITSLNLTTNQLTFNATTTTFVAAVNGTWAPAVGGTAGSAPANYGGRASILGNAFDFAVRDLTASVGAATVSLTPTGVGTYSFPTNQTLTLTGATSLDYNGLGASGNEPLAGQGAVNAGAVGTLVDLGGNSFRITYPVALTINDTVEGQPVVINLNGTLTSQGTLTPVPEPATVGLIGAAVLGAGAAVRRKWRGEPAVAGRVESIR